MFQCIITVWLVLQYIFLSSNFEWSSTEAIGTDLALSLGLRL